MVLGPVVVPVLPHLERRAAVPRPAHPPPVAARRVLTARPRTDLLTTADLYNLDGACRIISRAFRGGPPYLVGSAGISPEGASAPQSYRDVDVRLILDEEEFAEACPTMARWELLCVAITAYLHERTGLPVDFQIQRQAEASERFKGCPRNPVGMGRIFAGGGDGTPEWPQVSSG